MGILRRKICFLYAAALSLLLCGCFAQAENSTQSGEAGQTAVTITAAFQHEDGTALAGGAIRFSDKENSADYALDENGTLVLSGLPMEGELTVTVLDQQAQAQAEITLSFSQGSVIDVVTGEDGIGHVTLKEDTEELALNFILYDDNSMRCSLRLAQSRIV